MHRLKERFAERPGAKRPYFQNEIHGRVCGMLIFLYGDEVAAEELGIVLKNDEPCAICQCPAGDAPRSRIFPCGHALHRSCFVGCLRQGAAEFVNRCSFRCSKGRPHAERICLKYGGARWWEGGGGCESAEVGSA